MTSAEALVLDISNPDRRENALHELSKKRDMYQDLAPLLWNSFGTIAALLQEIISIYPLLSPPNLTPAQSNRVCNALALLQCVASHPETKMLFLKAQLPSYLYPLLHTTSKSRPFEFLRLTSLGVIGALVKDDDERVIRALIPTDIIMLSVLTMQCGSELSKTVSTFIMLKILSDALGLEYVCTSADKFFHLTSAMNYMLECLVEQPSPRLLKHIMKCYFQLSEHKRGVAALKDCFPDLLRGSAFDNCLNEDPATKKFHQQLLLNVQAEELKAALQACQPRNHMPVNGS